MKLPLPAIVVFLFLPSSGALLSIVSAPLCLQPQKNQPHWLAHATSRSNHSPHPFCFFKRPALHTRLAPFR
jgi:hypothetical protein